VTLKNTIPLYLPSPAPLVTLWPINNMKKILIGLVAVIILGAAGYFGYAHFAKGPGGGGPGGGLRGRREGATRPGTTKKAIAAPITQDVSTSSDATLGDVTKDQASVTIARARSTAPSRSTLDAGQRAKVRRQRSGHARFAHRDFRGQADAPERQGDRHFQNPADKIPAADQVDHLRVVYFDGTTWEYIKPDSVDLTSGTITFSTYHFSTLGAANLKGNDKIKSDWVKSQVLDNTLTNKSRMSPTWSAKRPWT